jgi:hypothetical protein
VSLAAYDALQTQAMARSLTVLGGFHPVAADKAPAGCGTLLLLGPDEPAFWPAFTQSREYRDGSPDAMDRWSTRVIGAWAGEMGAEALYPFGGAPYLPFFSWATRTERTHASPIRLLVHDTAGLFVSFRGALALPDRIALPAAPPRPCDSCPDRPCLTACPVDALGGDGYDVPACKAYLATEPGQDCMSEGCAARRACPISKSWGRDPAQSAYHMRYFTRN